MEEKHTCTQERVLATMCEQLKNIVIDIRDIKDGQKLFMMGLNSAQLNSAKYPTPEFVNKAVAKLDKHETYFKIIGASMIAAWGLILFLVDKVWK